MERPRTTATLAAVAALTLVLAAGAALAEGFGTPTMDGLLTGDESIYGAAEASDPSDPPQGFTHLDMENLYVANDDNFWYFLFRTHSAITSPNWGKYMLFIDVTNDGVGAPDDSSSAWNRDITFDPPHQPEYSIRGWVDNFPYGIEDTQFWSWSGATWVADGSADGAAISTSANGIEWKIAKSRIGNPTTLWCEVISTGGDAGNPAQDTVNDPADDWNAANWDSTSFIDVSTEVAMQSGVDVTPPTVIDACIESGFNDRVLVTYNEPMNVGDAATEGNYTDLGGKTVTSVIPVNSTTFRVFVSPGYGTGSCEQIKATGVRDLAGNTIVDNGTTNVGNFYRFQLFVQGNMSIHMQEDDTPPHTFGIEGSVLPLTWDPTGDFPMSDPDVDSTYTTFVSFCLPCSLAGAGPEDTQLEYKFTHQGTEYESGSNHFYQIDLDSVPAGADTVDIWWNDVAPVDFTARDVGVVLTVTNRVDQAAFVSGDSIGLTGSQLPLTFDVAPPLNFMADDGVPPDVTSGDGTYSSQITFPAGTFKNVEFKYVLKALADTSFAFECEGIGNRNVFLNDTLFNATDSLIVLDLAYYDDCLYQTGVDDFQVRPASSVTLEQSRPNPTRDVTIISYTLSRSEEVTLTVYDVSGRLVRELVNEVRPEGRHNVVWNGRRRDGTLLPSGVYFYNLKAGTFDRTAKIILTR